MADRQSKRRTGKTNCCRVASRDSTRNELIYKLLPQSGFIQICSHLRSMNTISGTHSSLHILKLSSVNIVSVSWKKQSHGLFDYETWFRHTNDQMYDLTIQPKTQSIKIYKNIENNNLIYKVLKDTKELQPFECFVSKLLIEKKNKATRFTLFPNHPDEETNSERTPFICLRDYYTEEGQLGYILRPGKVIKLGRVEFIVLEIKTSQGTFVMEGGTYLDTITSTYEVQVQKLHSLSGSTFTCRICFCEMNQKNMEADPLMSPCKCKGSCGFIHLNCLRKWMNSKITKHSAQFVTSFNFNKFSCEICQHPFPKIVKIRSKEIEMIKLNRPEGEPYLLMQSQGFQENEEEVERSMYLLTIGRNQKVRLGRGQSCEIKMSDISVSRNHCEISFDYDKFVLRDSNSKFGTLVKFDESERLGSQRSIRIQLGRTLFEFNLKGDEEETE